MSQQISDDEVYELAKKRVKAKKGFYGHFVTWASVNVLLIIIWALTDVGGYPWFLWPLCIWGFFVLLNYIQVFLFPATSDKHAIEKEVDRIKRSHS